FFGRAEDIVRIRAHLAEQRLITLTGPGGIGKTRLALKVAEALVEDFADGVWLVELAALADPALVPQHVAASLGLPDQSSRPSAEVRIASRRPRQALVVLDNCEHLLSACAQLTSDLLRTCPGLRLLTTSRQPLGIDGETVWRVPSLPYPDAQDLGGTHAVLE